LQLCEPKIRSLETDNRFTEARLAIGSGDNLSPLAIDLSRRGSGGVSGPRFLVSGSFGHARSARHPRMGTTQEGRQGRRRQQPPIFKNKRGWTNTHLASCGCQAGLWRRLTAHPGQGPPPRPVPTFEVAAHRSGRDDHSVRTTMVRTRILDELFDLAVRAARFAWRRVRIGWCRRASLPRCASLRRRSPQEPEAIGP
jgi:hypothetical protein